MCSKCCGNCIYAWGEQWHNSVDGVKYEYYCAQEKDDRGDFRLLTHKIGHSCDKFTLKELQELKGDKNNG